MHAILARGTARVPALGVACKSMPWWGFIALIGGWLAAWPFFAAPPVETVPLIGFLSSASRDPFAQQLAAFHRGLHEAGFVEGRNVAIEYRWADGQYDRL